METEDNRAQQCFTLRGLFPLHTHLVAGGMAWVTRPWPHMELKVTSPAPPHYVAPCRWRPPAPTEDNPSHHPDAAMLLAAQVGPILQFPKQNRKKLIILLHTPSPLFQCFLSPGSASPLCFLTHCHSPR